MNRRLTLLVTSPALLVATLMLGACGFGLWAVNELHDRLVGGFHAQIESLTVAADLQAGFRQLWEDALLERLQPGPERLAETERGLAAFGATLDRARRARLGDFPERLADVEAAYLRLRADVHESTRPRTPNAVSAAAWAESHRLAQFIAPCRALLDAHREAMSSFLHETEASDAAIDRILVVLAAVGPVLGVACGYAIARSLSRSIGRLHGYVRDAHREMGSAAERSAAEVPAATGDFGALDDRMREVVDRVRGLVDCLRSQQAEIVRGEQLAVAGRLAAGIAHEIRNPLTTMKWLIEDALRAYPSEPLGLEDLRVLRGEVERMEQTVQQMLDFARPAPPQPRACDLRDLTRQAVELTRVRRRQLGVGCELELPAAPVRASVDPARVKSVLVNLLLNALDAMPAGGQIRVRLNPTGLGDWSLSVEDSGTGIPPDVAERLFTPFATTKPNGTGLGLIMARRYVEEHGGSLAAENRPEGGARFTIRLPVQPAV